MAAVHKIVDDFYDDPYELVALHSSLEDYELAYFINLHLKSRLARCREDLRLSIEASFPIFEWKDRKNDRIWSLIINNCVQENQLKTVGLFEGEPSFTTHHLVPEYKEVDFFLKIEGDAPELENGLLRPLLQIPKVITAYRLDADKLKSKNNLIVV